MVVRREDGAVGRLFEGGLARHLLEKLFDATTLLSLLWSVSLLIELPHRWQASVAG